MPVVPKYEDYVKAAGMPDVRVRGNTAPFEAAARTAGAANRAGAAISEFGGEQFKVFQARQDEEDRVEFIKLKALRDSEAQKIIQRESEGGVYEGFDARVQAGLDEYDKTVIPTLKQRMQKQYQNMTVVSNAGLMPGVLETREKMRSDKLGADALTAVNAAIQQQRWDEARAYIDSVPVSVWDNEKKAELKVRLEKSQRAFEIPQKADALYKQFNGDYVDGVEWIQENVPEGNRKAFTDAFQSCWNDMESVKTATYKKTRDELANVYLHQGNLKGVDLQGLVASGQLDSDGALMWQNRIEADQEKIAKRAERFANADEKMFKLSLKNMTPIQQEYARHDHYFGMKPAALNKNYNEAAKKLEAGTLTFDDIAALSNNALIIPIQAEMLANDLKAQATTQGRIYNDTRSSGKSALNRMLGTANISESIKQDILMEYDVKTREIGSYKPEDLYKVALEIAKGRLEQNDVKKKKFLFIDTDAQDFIEDTLQPALDEAYSKAPQPAPAPDTGKAKSGGKTVINGQDIDSFMKQ